MNSTRILLANIKSLVFVKCFALVFAYSSLSVAQEMPSAPEIRSLFLMGVYGAYYCDIFKGNDPDFASIRNLLRITDQEASDPILDSLGQYLGSRIKSYSPSCTMSEYKNKRDAMLQVIFEEWARQNPQARRYFPFSYNFFGF